MIRGVSSDGSLVAMWSSDGTAELVSTADGTTLLSPDVGADLFKAFFSPDNAYLITNNNGIERPFYRIWDIATGTLVNSFGGEGDSLAGGLKVDFTADSSKLIHGSYSGEVVVFDFEALLGGADPVSAATLRFDAHLGRILSVRLSPDEKLLTTNVLGEPVKLWDIETGDPVAEFGSTNNPAAVFGPSGDSLLVAESGAFTIHTLELRQLLDTARRSLTRELTETECQRYLGSSCRNDR